MALWLVRAGKNGEQEQPALDHGFITIGWNDMPDLRGINSREEVQAELLKHQPSSTQGYLTNVGSQIWRFAKEIKKDDLVVLPSKRQASIAIGIVTGEYEHRYDIAPGVRHLRLVKWVRTDIPRTAFEQDLLYSFGAYMTVCKIQRNRAEERVKAIVAGKPIQNITNDHDDVSAEEADIEQAARDQILSHIDRKFKGHGLARLVEGVLKAQGYQTLLSPPGPDGGIDILASGGPLGFSSPKILVQVKSSSTPCNVEVLRTLQGVMGNVRAEFGLLVSWGGFNRKVLDEARVSFFNVRLWDSGQLLESILKDYDMLNPDLQAELQLKRTFVLVPEEAK